MSVAKDVILFFLHCLIFSLSECAEFPTCNINKLSNCGNIEGIECNANTSKCECALGYEYHPDSDKLETNCIKKLTPGGNEGEDTGNNTVSVVIVVLLTLLLLGSALFFIVRRYNLLHWVHNKIFSRRNTGATYEDVMIGQDDPPITA